jgi:hypothetical protein
MDARAILLIFVVIVIVLVASAPSCTAWTAANSFLSTQATKVAVSDQATITFQQVYLPATATRQWELDHATPTLTPVPTATPAPTATPQPNVVIGVAQTFSALAGYCAGGIFVIGIVLVVLVGLSKVPLWVERKARTGQQRAAGADYFLPDGSVASTDRSTGTITPQRNQHDWLSAWDRFWHYVRHGELKPLPDTQKPLMSHELSGQQAVVLSMVANKYNGEAEAAQAQRLPDMPKNVQGDFRLEVGARTPAPPLPAQTAVSDAEILNLGSGVRGSEWQLVSGVLNQLGLALPKPAGQQEDVVEYVPKGEE